MMFVLHLYLSGAAFRLHPILGGRMTREPIIDHRILIADTQNHNQVKQSFDMMHIEYDEIRVHTAEGIIPAFRVSMTACILLATIKLIQSN